MDEKYYAVTRTTPSDELCHWKYIKKKKVNGKWRYFYDQGEVDKYEKGMTKQYKDKDGTLVTETYQDDKDYVRSYDKTFSVSNGMPSPYGGKARTNRVKRVTHIRGKAQRFSDRAIAKGEKFIFDNILNAKPKKKKKRKK